VSDLKVVDVSKQMEHAYPAPIRPETQITQIVIHHDAAAPPKPGKEIERLKRYSHMHAAEGWGGIGYHYAIGTDGTVYKCNPVTSRTNHAKGGNKQSIGVMLFGNFMTAEPTKAQLTAACALVRVLRAKIPSIKTVVPHRKVKGSNTACPGTHLPDSVISTW